jgi:hypothetical protein
MAPLPVIAEDGEIREFAERALDCCVAWFGQPPDPEWPCRITAGRTAGCRRSRIARRYTVYYRSGYRHVEQNYAEIAEELFYRVAYSRPMTARGGWVAEMLSILTMLSVLDLEGYPRFAEFLRAHYRENDARLTVRELESAVTRGSFLLNATYRPPGFGASVAVRGMDLTELIGWPAVCSLVDASSVGPWISGLDANVRAAARAILTDAP